ncbi:hypothetical protein B0H14DRAFT_3864102 [Mycena olivaceomarginata]|nr:hypothetical protein B0H14DRAFT_3864102 [Mycena olivaceomarginata]
MVSTGSDKQHAILASVQLRVHRRTVGVYLAGGLIRPPSALPYSLHPSAIPAVVRPRQLALPRRLHPLRPREGALGQPDTPVPVHVTFVDWLPGLCSLLGFLVINLIDKNRVRGDAYTFGDARAVWRRAAFPVHWVCLDSGWDGWQRRVLTIKYVLPTHADQFKYYGYASVAQNTSDDYEYNVTL